MIGLAKPYDNTYVVNFNNKRIIIYFAKSKLHIKCYSLQFDYVIRYNHFSKGTLKKVKKLLEVKDIESKKLAVTILINQIKYNADKLLK